MVKKLLSLVGGILLAALPVFGQSAGAVRAQEVYSTTGHVKFDNSINTAVVPVTYGATTTFNGANGDHFEETLTGDVDTVTTTSFVSGTNYSFKICQDSTGNRAFIAPGAFNGWVEIATAPNSCTTQTGYYDGTNVNFPASKNSTTSSTSTANGLISGCGIFYTGSGMVYTITACNYQIGGIVYSSPQTNITLSDGDVSFDRIDVFEVDNTGAAGHITGTASATPVEPSVDPLTQINVGFVSVPVGSTTPTGVTTTVVYEENAGSPTEWDCTTSGTDFDCADTTHPFAGTKDVATAGQNVSDYAKFTIGSGSVGATDNNILIIEAYSAAAWTGKDEVWVTLYSGANAVGNTVFTTTNNFGWNGAVSGSYQAVVIPIASFGLASTDTYDNIRLVWNNGGRKAAGTAMYFDNIWLQSNQVSGGGGGSTGGVSSVNIAGDGIVIKPALSGCPITSNGTCTMSLVNVDAGKFLAGPIGSDVSNVGVRQFVHCTHSTAVNADSNKSFSCPAFSSNLIAGDLLLVMAPGLANNSTAGFTDTQGNTFTIKSTGGSNPNLAGVATATIGTSGSDVVSGTGIHWWDNGGSWSQYDFWVYELTGASAINLAYVNASASGSSITQAISPGASTDALIRLTISGSNNVATPQTGTITFSPAGSTLASYTAADVNMGLAKTDFYAPGSTSSSINVATYTSSGGPFILLADITQSASAGAAPPVYRRILEGDLPNSAKTGIQSVSTFNMASSPINLPSATNTTVISGAVTMPSDGCPCRVLVQGGIFWTASPNGSTADGWWFSDGTNTFGWQVRVPTDSASDAAVSAAISPVAYSNNQTVTFSFVFNPGTYSGTTIQAVDNISPPLPAAAKSWMTVSVMQSRN